MRLLKLVAALLTLLVVTSCGEVRLPGDFGRCTNPDAGYQIEYPGGWHTNEPNHIPECSVFDTSQFDLQPGAPVPASLAIRLTVEEVPFEEAVAVDPDVEQELLREDSEVGGRQAVLLETEATGRGREPRGTMSYRYVIELDQDRTLVAATFDAGELSYVQKRGMLNRMMGAIEFLDNG